MKKNATDFIKSIYTLLLLTAMTSVGAAQVIYVDQNATGTGDGASWTNAVTDLQSAIDLAAGVATAMNPMQVWVKADTYYPTSGIDRTISFEMKDYVELYGGFVGTESTLSQRDFKNNNSILSGDIGVLSSNTDNSFSVIFAGAAVVNTARIDGFHIANASTVGAGSFPFAGGVAITSTAQEVIIVNCEIYDNDCSFGSGFSTFWGGSSTGNYQISNSVFYNNKGAIWTTRNLEVVNTMVIGSTGFNGAILRQTGNLKVINSTIFDNAAGIELIEQGSNPTAEIYNSIIWGNTGSDISISGNAADFLTAENNIIEDGLTGGTNILTDDPLFFDGSTYDLRIKHCSPAVDQGDNSKLSTSFTEDLGENPRTFGISVDLGAYENQVTPLSFSAVEVSDVSCNGGSDGQISVNAAGGSGSVMYSIDGISFSANAVFSGLSAGTFEVTLLDNGTSCTYSENFTVNEPSALSIIAMASPAKCNGDSDGKIEGSVSGGAGPYQLSFDGGSSFVTSQFTSTFEVSNLSAGSYEITVVDAGSCSFTLSPDVVVTEPDVITASASSTDALCFGGATGEITASASGGNTPLYYTLGGINGNYQSSPSFTGLAAGNYIVTVVDSKLCFIDVPVVVNEPAALSFIAISSMSVSCNGDSDGYFSFSGAGGVGPYEYSIDGTNFQTSSLFENQSAGTYTITLRDANSCTATMQWEVTQPGVLTVSADATGTTTCGGADGQIELTPAGGTFPFRYRLNGGPPQTNPVFSGLSAGQYTISIDDSKGCISMITSTISDPVTSNITATPTDIECNGTATGGIVVSVNGGSSPFEYSLDGINFQTSNQFDNLVSGNYSITVKEGTGCTQTVSTVISEPSALTGTAVITDLSCFESGNGEISITATGGTGAIEYSIDGTNFQSGNTFTGLSAGSYDVTIIDANNCSYLINTSLDEPLEVMAAASTSNASCIGSLDGSITVTTTNGVAPFSYSLDGGTVQSGNVFDLLDPGTYSIAVMDANGCGSTLTDIVVEASTTIVPSLMNVDILCNGDATGEISITTTGGTTPYEYSIDGTNYQSDATFSNLVAGSYIVTVRDANGCSGTEEIELTEPSALAVSVAQNDKSFVITATGGSSPYEYSLDGTNFQSSSNFNDLDFGNYTFTVRDANGCTIESDEFSIVLGLDSNENRISVYPNPTSDYLFISSDKVTMVRVFDLNGKMQQQYDKAERIDISDLKAGLYLILLLDDNAEVLSTNRLLKD
ncbi:MAG: T9SS type A sorting domain-containing protein [Cyclobacteriaceae bacterium]